MSQPASEINIQTAQTLDTMLHQILNVALVAIEAEAGSLMLVDDKRGILQIKARLGKPRPGRRTEPVYRIGERGIAGWVVQNRQAYLCDDVDDDPFFTPTGDEILAVGAERDSGDIVRMTIQTLDDLELTQVQTADIASGSVTRKCE